MEQTVVPLDAGVAEQIKLLSKKYSSEGQSLICNIEKLMFEKPIEYNEYICQEVLLNIQFPKSTYSDEMIFIVYHQIVELYFKLILWELEQMTSGVLEENIFLDKIERINRYYKNLVFSFDVVIDGFDKKQFHAFRKALFPASGFQSLQYRLIELYSTDLSNLRVDELNQNQSDFYEQIYWKRGAIDTKTGAKDISLVNFERKYDSLLRRKAKEMRNRNLWKVFQKCYSYSTNRLGIIEALKNFDYNANVGWKLAHLRAASKHLVREGGEAMNATGGTNWRKYLPAKNQKIIFFPELLSADEKAKWGNFGHSH